MSLKGSFRAVSDVILGLLFPERCAFCDTVICESDGGLCPLCKKKDIPAGDDICLKCGRALAEGEERQEYCPDCRRLKHYFDMGRSLYPYDAVVTKSIYRLKYAGRRRYALFYGRRMAGEFGPWLKSLGRGTVLVPVPLHKKRQTSRGYNQAELIARSISGHTGVPVRTDLVSRIKNTAPLKLLDRAGRQVNLKNAFKIGRFEVKLETVVLVDDIYTTGSTVDEISRLLKGKGVRRVYFLTAAAGS